MTVVKAGSLILFDLGLVNEFFQGSFVKAKVVLSTVAQADLSLITVINVLGVVVK